jgi:hypothetical protein
MATIKAEFDGRVFIPCQTVNLPPGTQVGIFIPEPPPPLTEEENRAWERIKAQLATSEPYFPTVEDALRYSRKYP